MIIYKGTKTSKMELIHNGETKTLRADDTILFIGIRNVLISLVRSVYDNYIQMYWQSPHKNNNYAKTK